MCFRLRQPRLIIMKNDDDLLSVGTASKRLRYCIHKQSGCFSGHESGFHRPFYLDLSASVFTLERLLSIIVGSLPDTTQLSVFLIYCSCTLLPMAPKRSLLTRHCRSVILSSPARNMKVLSNLHMPIVTNNIIQSEHS